MSQFNFLDHVSANSLHSLMITLARRELLRRARPSLARQYATPPKEPNPQLNGYPELPDVSHQYRPALGWQDKLLRRNFGDTVRVDLPLTL